MDGCVAAVAFSSQERKVREGVTFKRRGEGGERGEDREIYRERREIERD